MRRTSPPSAPTPPQITHLAPANHQLKESIGNAQKLRTDFEKLPSITPAIYLRLGRCFYELDRKWEAAVVNQEILDRFKDSREREPALFGLIVALAEVNQPQRTEERCEQYLRDFRTDRTPRRRVFVRRGRIAGGRSKGRGGLFKPHSRDATKERIP